MRTSTHATLATMTAGVLAISGCAYNSSSADVYTASEARREATVRFGMIESVRVTVRLFAGLRERAGTARLEIADVSCVGDVWAKRFAALRADHTKGDWAKNALCAACREWHRP